MGNSKVPKISTIGSLNKDTSNESDDCVSITETEEIGPTHELEIYWPLGDQYYPGSVSHYSEATEKHRIAYGDGQVEKLKMKECLLIKLRFQK